MIFLLLSILTNTAIYLIFKWYGKMNIRILDAIVFNYITAGTIGLAVVDDLPQAFSAASEFPDWAVAAVALGMIFISVFYLMSVTSQRIGVGVATVASKMSLVVAVLLFVMAGRESMSSWGGLALIMALMSVVFVSVKEPGKKTLIRMLAWPLLILLGSTAIDFTIAWYADQPATEGERALYSCLSFITAACIGLVVLLIRFIRTRELPTPRYMAAGVFLGSVNYGSIYFLVQSYHSELMSTARVLQVNNLAVVVCGALAARILFKEKWSALNVTGLALGVLALAILMLT
jgi:drug/metabolite transporter (DMT)-like permease